MITEYNLVWATVSTKDKLLPACYNKKLAPTLSHYNNKQLCNFKLDCDSVREILNFWNYPLLESHLYIYNIYIYTINVAHYINDNYTYIII